MRQTRSLQRELKEFEEQRSGTCSSSTGPTRAGATTTQTGAALPVRSASLSLTHDTSSTSPSSSGVRAARASDADNSSAEDDDAVCTTGSRFDILTRGSFSDGKVCSRACVRRAAKTCKLGHKTANLASAAGDEHRAAAAAAAEEVPGRPCGIPSRAPFKRLLAQPFSHILVADFEATCDSGSVRYPHEIIEFPVVVLDTATLSIVAQFHHYVRPRRNPTLTKFCTELTGITQAMVDSSEGLAEVVVRFQRWLLDEVYPLCRAWRARYGAEKLSTNLKSEQRRFTFDERSAESRAAVPEEQMICFATDGPWDMRRFMHECGVLRDGIDFPPVCYRYINVRHCFGEFFKTRQVKLTHMLRRLSMSFEGQRHSGIADTLNITRVLAELFARGYRVHHVSVIKYAHRGDAFLASNRAAQELLEEYGEEDERRPTRGDARGGKAKNHQRKAARGTGRRSS